jgi:hypothetical protein
MLFRRLKSSVFAALLLPAIFAGCIQQNAPEKVNTAPTSDTSLHKLMGKQLHVKKGPADIFADTTGKSRPIQ